MCKVTTALLLLSCQGSEPQSGLDGTYKTVENTTIKGKDTIFFQVDPTMTEMIKRFNVNNFAFFNHDLNTGQDNTSLFVSGAGTYSWDGDKYSENLDCCIFRPWEGKQFDFKLQINGDTLIQEGLEEIPELGINEYITEKYVRIK